MAGVISAVTAVPTTALVGVVLFGAYLLGIILTEIGKIAVQVVAGLWNLVPMVATILVFLILVLSYFPQLVLLAGVVAFIAWIKWRRLDDVPYLEYLSQLLNRGYLSALRFYEEAWNGLKKAWDPSRQQVDYMLREESNRSLASSADLRGRLTSQLPPRQLAEVTRRINLQEAEFQRQLATLAPDLRPLTLSKALRRVKTESRVAAVVRAAVNDRIAGNAEARRIFILAAISTARMQADVKSRVDRAHVQLRAQYEGIYNEYDRLRSEGEFRTAIAVPLFGLLGSISYLLIDELGLIGDKVYIFYTVAGVASLAMLAAGGSKKSEAAQLLYASVRQQLVQNADTRDYGFEYFPNKYRDLDIDLGVLSPSIEFRQGVVRRIGGIPILGRFVRQKSRP